MKNNKILVLKSGIKSITKILENMKEINYKKCNVLELNFYVKLKETYEKELQELLILAN